MPKIPTITETIYALADMVLQFAFRNVREFEVCLFTGGNDTLSHAFAVLEAHGCPTVARGWIRMNDLLRFMSEKFEIMKEEDKQCG